MSPSRLVNPPIWAAIGSVSLPFRDIPPVRDRQRVGFPATPGQPCHFGTSLRGATAGLSRHGRDVPFRLKCPKWHSPHRSEPCAGRQPRFNRTARRMAKDRANNQRAWRAVRIRRTANELGKRAGPRSGGQPRTNRRSGAVQTLNEPGGRSGLGGFNTSCEPCEHGSFVAAVPDRPPSARRARQAGPAGGRSGGTTRRAPPKPPETARPGT